MTSTGPSSRPRASALFGLGDRLDALEVRPARARRASRSSSARGLLLRVAMSVLPADASAPRASRRRPCRGGSTRRSSTSPRLEPARAASRRPRACARRRGSRRALGARVVPGSATLDFALDRVPGECLGGLARAADRRRAPSGTSSRHSSSGEHDRRSGRATASFSRAICLARVAEDVGVLEPDVRQQDDRRVEDVRRVEPAAEPGLDDGCVDAARGEVGERGRGQRLELRRADRLGRRADARDRALERLGRRCRAARASRSRAATCTRRRRGPSARSSAAIVRVAVDLPFVPTTCTERNARCGSPSASSSACMRPRPNSSGHGDSDATHSVWPSCELAVVVLRGAARSLTLAYSARAGSFVLSTWSSRVRAAAVRPPSARARGRSLARGRAGAPPAA